MLDEQLNLLPKKHEIYLGVAEEGRGRLVVRVTRPKVTCGAIKGGLQRRQQRLGQRRVSNLA
jgi:hypothetical protein